MHNDRYIFIAYTFSRVHVSIIVRSTAARLEASKMLQMEATQAKIYDLSSPALDHRLQICRDSLWRPELFKHVQF